MTFPEATSLREAIDKAYPHGYQVSQSNWGGWGWTLKIRRRGDGPHDPSRALFTSLPVWVLDLNEWPQEAERLGIDIHLVEQMGGPPAPRAGSLAGPPSAEPGGSTSAPSPKGQERSAI